MQYLSIFVNIWPILVTPTHVCYADQSRRCFFLVWHALLKKTCVCYFFVFFGQYLVNIQSPLQAGPAATGTSALGPTRLLLVFDVECVQKFNIVLHRQCSGPLNSGYVRSTVGGYSARYAKYTQYIDKY